MLKKKLMAILAAGAIFPCLSQANTNYGLEVYGEVALIWNFANNAKYNGSIEAPTKFTKTVNGKEDVTEIVSSLNFENEDNKISSGANFAARAGMGIKNRVSDAISIGGKFFAEIDFVGTKSDLNKMNITGGIVDSEGNEFEDVTIGDFEVDEEDKNKGMLSFSFEDKAMLYKKNDGTTDIITVDKDMIKGAVNKTPGEDIKINNAPQKFLNKIVTDIMADRLGGNEESKTALKKMDLSTIGKIAELISGEKLVHIGTLVNGNPTNFVDALNPANGTSIVSSIRLYHDKMTLASINTSGAPGLSPFNNGRSVLNKPLANFLDDATTPNNGSNTNNLFATLSGPTDAHTAFTTGPVSQLVTNSQNLDGRFFVDSNGKVLPFNNAIANYIQNISESYPDLKLGLLKVKAYFGLNAGPNASALNPLEAIKKGFKDNANLLVLEFDDGNAINNGVVDYDKFVKNYEKYIKNSVLFKLAGTFNKNNNLNKNGGNAELVNMPLVNVNDLWAFTEQGVELNDADLAILGITRAAEDKGKYYIYVDGSGNPFIFRGGNVDLVNKNATMKDLEIAKFISHENKGEQTIEVLEIKKRNLIKLGFDGTLEFHASTGFMGDVSLEISAGPRYSYAHTTAKVRLSNSYDANAKSHLDTSKALGMYKGSDITRNVFDFAIKANELNFVTDGSETQNGTIETEGSDAEQKIKFANHAVGGGFGLTAYKSLGIVDLGLGFHMDMMHNFDAKYVEDKDNKKEETSAIKGAEDKIESENKNQINMGIKLSARVKFK